jgi:hypothetical protein
MVILKKSTLGYIAASLFLILTTTLFGLLVYATYFPHDEGGILSIPWISARWFALLEDYTNIIWFLPVLILFGTFIIYCILGGLRIEKKPVAVRPRGSRRQPAVFTEIPTAGETHLIYYKESDWSYAILLLIWLILWGSFCVHLLYGYFNGGRMDDGSPIPLWFVMVFWVPNLVFIYQFVYALTYKKSYRTDTHNLIVEAYILGLKQSQLIIPKNTISGVVQVIEKQEDSSSWDINVRTHDSQQTSSGNGADEKEYSEPAARIHQRVKIFSSSRYGSSEWLGQTLAKWLEVDFIKAPLD